jgi:hypothetical protein
MAGCSSGRLCSAKCLRGVSVLHETLEGLKAFMDRQGYDLAEEFWGAPETMMMLRDLPKGGDDHLATGNVVWENRGLHRIWVKD